MNTDLEVSDYSLRDCMGLHRATRRVPLYGIFAADVTSENRRVADRETRRGRNVQVLFHL